jgi:Asp-tRNA(Asn)/Glu-tRNA(Gln) amidotransferase A subunit family amidase
MARSSTTAEIDDLCFTPAVELASALRRKELSSRELIAALLDRIERVNPTVNAFVTILAEQALEDANNADQQAAARSHEELGTLHGLPVTVKDLTPTAGVLTTFGHPAFRENVPDEDGVIWARLKAAGAILLAKTATPAFGEHSITESKVHGVTNNPWDPTRTVGGSSGGAAASVAAGIGPLATGSDGGGSIRVPSALCGVVGLKASRGRIPYRGDGSPLEQVTVVGPITRTVRDNAMMLNVVAGPDPYEMFALQDGGFDYLSALDGASVAALRIAYSPDLGAPPIEPDVREVVRQAAFAFDSDLGAHVDEIVMDLPDPLDYFADWWSPQAAMIVEDVAALGGNFEPDPQLRPILEHAYTMSAVDYARVQFETRAAIHRAFAEVFLYHDLLVWPTTPMVAFPHPGEAGGPTTVAGQEVRFPPLQNQRYTEAISHAGYPAITVPAGWTAEGLPVGLQIAGPHAADAAVLIAAAAFEQARPWAGRRPSL